MAPRPWSARGEAAHRNITDIGTVACSFLLFEMFRSASQKPIILMHLLEMPKCITLYRPVAALVIFSQ